MGAMKGLYTKDTFNLVLTMLAHTDRSHERFYTQDTFNLVLTMLTWIDNGEVGMVA